jgi:Kef-type K+ transport system membrane component KefB
LLHIPTIVSYIAAGLFVGPGLGLLRPGEALGLISESGIALLLFLVGLELSLDKVRNVGRVAAVAGFGQVVLTAAAGYAVSRGLGFTPPHALFLAVAMTFSSTVVVVKLLDQKGDLDRLYGRIAVGIFLVQDGVVMALLTLLAGMQGDDRGTAAMLEGLVPAFGGMALLLVAVLAASKWVLSRPFAWAAPAPDMLLIFALAWCFAVVMGAHALHLSVEIGAFLAGFSLAQLPYSADLARRVHPLMSFFLAVFFVTLGAKMNLAAAGIDWIAIVALSVFVLIGKLALFMGIVSRFGYGERTAFAASVTLSQISEFSFILAAAALGTGWIDETLFTVVGIVGLTTIAVSSPMILQTDRLYSFASRRGLLRIFRAASKEDDAPQAPLRNHVVVVGMNALGRDIVNRMLAKGEVVLAIDTDPRKFAGLTCRTMLGNVEYPSVLHEAGLASAKLAVSALQIEATNHLFAFHCKSMGVPCAIHACDVSVIDDLLELGADYLMTPKVDSAILIRRILSGKETPAP